MKNGTEDMAREVLVAELQASGFLDCTGNSQRDFATYRAMQAFADMRLDEAAGRLRKRADLLRTPAGRGMAQWHENDANMVAAELKRQSTAIESLKERKS